jgi:hypothetical protein
MRDNFSHNAALKATAASAKIRGNQNVNERREDGGVAGTEGDEPVGTELSGWAELFSVVMPVIL